MRETLEALAAGRISVAEAEADLAGYATTDAGRFDAARETRRGVPEAILGDGKTADEVASLAATAVETTGRALATRVGDETANAVREALDADVTVAYDPRAGVVVAHAESFERPAVDATVTVVTGGTSDAVPAREAAAVAHEMGAEVARVEDVGVANLTRITDQLPALRAADVLVVAAGREGALPTVVAGLVDVPVVGLPVSSGYGHGGDGEAALLGLLQSCTVLSVVNVDAGFVAGAQAGLLAQAVGAARAE
jgi:NCAIR mutase (PurE)-related protein